MNTNKLLAVIASVVLALVVIIDGAMYVFHVVGLARVWWSTTASVLLLSFGVAAIALTLIQTRQSFECLKRIREGAQGPQKNRKP